MSRGILSQNTQAVQIVGDDGEPLKNFGGGSSAPNAPAQTATASGSNLTQNPVNVSNAAGGVLVSPASSVARVVSLSLPTTATDAVQLSFVNPPVFGVGIFTLLPGGLYETPVPITKPLYAIAQSGTQTVTRVEFL